MKIVRPLVVIKQYNPVTKCACFKVNEFFYSELPEKTALPNLKFINFAFQQAALGAAGQHFLLDNKESPIHSNLLELN